MKKQKVDLATAISFQNIISKNNNKFAKKIIL